MPLRNAVRFLIGANRAAEKQKAALQGGFLDCCLQPPERVQLLGECDQFGGRYKDRTCDPYHVKVVLYR
jgi:hypothetical protein